MRRAFGSGSSGSVCTAPFHDPSAGARHLIAVIAALSLAACGSDDPFTPPDVTYEVSLDSGEFAVASGAQIAGALAFPGEAQDAGYLVVGQLAATTPDLSSSFIVGGQRSRAASGSAATAGAPHAGLRFHAALRRRESALLLPPVRPALSARRAPPPVVGDPRTFRVCGDLDCFALVNVPATARYVGSHSAIFLDDSVPAGGFSDGELALLGAQFDGHLYPIAVDRFGAESDIDGNGLVIILLTRKVNALVPRPDCDFGFVSGYFYGADITPGTSTSFNDGEVFYGMVPDPLGSASCARSKSLVSRQLPVTLIHEFQHMISYNQHVLVRGQSGGERLWLNEALSHLAEELGGLHYDSAGVDSTASTFFLNNLLNAYDYLVAPAATPLITEEPPGSLASRGAGWLFVRWLLDQYGQDLSRTLVESPLTGSLNVAAASGAPISDLVARWALGLYVDAPASVAYTTWNLRATYASLHQQQPLMFPRAYPLEPHVASSATGTFVSGTLRAGSGSWLVATAQGGTAGFDLYFRQGEATLFPPAAAPQVAILRLY